MRFGLEPGPEGSTQHQNSHYVYDVRSGTIVATFHFVGAARKLDEELRQRLLNQAHANSTVPLEHLAVLTESAMPSGEGPLLVDAVAKRLVRAAARPFPRVRA